VIERMARHVEPDGMATMTCVAFDSLTYEVAYSSAGHVPPLLVDSADQTITRLTASVGSPPLGWFAQSPPVDDTTSVIPGMTLALYSDGLVERRGVSLDDSIDGIGEAILDSSATPEAVVRTALGELADSPLEDDVALLVLQFQASPHTVEIEIPADPALLREMRRRLGRWLTLRGLEERKRSDAILAISEACNNAIEHGYRDRPGAIGIRLDHRDGWLQIRVADTGEWREPQVDATRGRGLLIIRSLMDDSDLVSSQSGTEVVLGQRL
jgi:anti-sigma regulatory factor (Ser/Thr protein kinase)